MALFGWLAAGFGDVVAIIVLLITVFLWILNQAAAKAAEANKRQQPKLQRQRPAAPPQRMPPQRGAPAPAGDRPQPPADPVEAFLRRAAEQRGARPAVAPRTEPEPVPARPTMPSDSGQMPPSSVADHVQRFLDSREFEERADRMGDDVEHAADDILEHLHAVFDRPLGTLGDMVSVSAAAAAEPVSQVTTELAADIVELLRNPTNVRNAIVMQEILRRPEFPVPGVRRSLR